MLKHPSGSPAASHNPQPGRPGEAPGPGGAGRTPWRAFLAAFALAPLLLLPNPAAAWNSAGHRLVASLAWSQLDPVVRERVAALLAAHPDSGRWTAKGADPATAFIECSTWPDDIRRDPRFHDSGADPTPPLPGFPDMDRHGNWHYVDRAADGHPLGGELDRQIDRLARQLADPATPTTLRSYALPWIVHLVADAHQPLHAGVRDDDGGNRVDVHDPTHPRLPVMSLHAWWDDLPGPPWLRGKRLEATARRLAERHSAPVRQGSPGEWIGESRALAASLAYPAEGDSPALLDAAFRDQARRIAGERLLAAGHRLARFLNGLLGDVSRETGATRSRPALPEPRTP